MDDEVALRKESVDRNCEGVSFLRKITMSLSARRAWIEMVGRSEGCWLSYVALRKESVDRNIVSALMFWPFRRRSPQGERG